MMINRGAVLLRYKQPMVDWVNSTHPADEEQETLSMEALNDDRTIFLVDDRDAEELDQWLALNFAQLFETELEDWSEDQALWPESLDMETFLNWFKVECHGLVIDTVGAPIVAMDEFMDDVAE